MRNILLSILFFFAFACAHAQEIKVRTFKELASDLAARTNKRLDVNGNTCALIKVQYPKPGASFKSFVIGDTPYMVNEYWVYVAPGAKRLEIHLPDAPTIMLEYSDYGISRVEEGMTYQLVFLFSGAHRGFGSSFYLGAGLAMGRPMGVDLSLGTYLAGFNVELDFQLPTAGGQDVYWNHPTSPSVLATYKPSFGLGGKLGYGIRMGQSMRLTPQLGLMLLKTSEKVADGADNHILGAYCSSLTVGARFQYFLGKKFALGLTPQYNAPIMKSKGFKTLSDVSPKIKKWNSGLGVKLDLSVEF